MSIAKTSEQIHFSKISIRDSRYPERVRLLLGGKSPENLYVAGNENLLTLPSVGFCGSRKSTEKGIETAIDCAEQLSRDNIVVVSGNAAGVDFVSHLNSLKSGGKTIFVLAEGINHFHIKKAFEPFWNWDNILVISQFEPNDIWQAYRAMTRNQLIIALSRAMIVIEAGDKGGTLNAGLETLKNELPLFVAEYQDMSSDAKGNKILLNKGAAKISKSKSTNRANLTRVMEKIKEDMVIKVGYKQQTLI